MYKITYINIHKCFMNVKVFDGLHYQFHWHTLYEHEGSRPEPVKMVFHEIQKSDDGENFSWKTIPIKASIELNTARISVLQRQLNIFNSRWLNDCTLEYNEADFHEIRSILTNHFDKRHLKKNNEL